MARNLHTECTTPGERPLPFVEIFVDAPLQVAEQRDPKGLYKKARAGEISNFTGVSAPYEKPLNPEIHVRTDQLTVDQCVNVISKWLTSQRLIGPIPGAVEEISG